jgi:hypothetical protein
MPPATEPAGGPRGLLLDIGGMVHATGIHLVGRLAEAEPAVRPVLDRIGGIGPTGTSCSSRCWRAR